MPPITSSPLTERLLQRLEHNLPHPEATERNTLKALLGDVLMRIVNVRLDHGEVVPAAHLQGLGEDGNLQTLYCALQRPCPGNDDPLSATERQTLRFVAHLRDIHLAGEASVENNIALLVARHERDHTLYNLRAEVMRELGSLPFPHAIQPTAKRAEIADVITEKLLLRCEAQRIVPTNARLFGFRELAPVAGIHAGAITGHIAAWNERAPPPMASVELPPGVDEATAFMQAPDPGRAPCQLDWTGIMPLSAESL